jgi:type II secretory pathway pseudopilin PulG
MTLVELMVAISIIAVIMTGLALSISVNYKAVALARNRQVAESVANQRLEEMRDIDYASLALSSQPSHNTDATNPDYWVSTNGLTYDVTGTGNTETLIVNTATGPVQHIETPVTVGNTVVDVYQYVTWVDDSSIPGTQNLKRISVVVSYHSVPQIGLSKILRESVLLTPGNVTLSGSATTTTSTTSSTSSTTSTTTTTTAPGNCGSFSVTGSSGASTGYTASTTVTITLTANTCGGGLIANFSNNGGASWGTDVSYTTNPTTIAWTLSNGDGAKTISGRLRSGSSGTPWNLASQGIILDTTAPTTPATLNRTLSCAGSTRTVTLTWSAATDSYLTGYHVYVSSGGAYSLLTSTSALTTTTTNSKTAASISYYVKAYDAAGNESNASPIVSLAKNQCT